MAGAESDRLAEDTRRHRNWKRWGPYLAERQWGTVREDYSEYGDCWNYLPHDHARSRAYRWGEDGLLGITDRQGRLCFALALWNGRDPILKERLFGLTGPEGNHGEDVKELYYYLDSTPTHSYLKALYKYPQAEYPYESLVRVNRERGKGDPEFELLDTGAFDGNRYFDVFAEYAKADADDILVRITVANRGPETATLHLLPTLWFRNTWSWGRDGEGYWPKPALRRTGPARIEAEHQSLGRYLLEAEPVAGAPAPELLFTDNETNTARLFGARERPALREGRLSPLRRRGRARRRQSRRHRDQGGRPLRTHHPAGGRASRAAPAAGAAARGRGGVRRRLRPGVRVPDPRGGRVLRRADSGCRDRGRAPGHPPGLRRAPHGPSSSSTTSWSTGSRAIPPSRHRRPAGARDATTSGRTSTTATSSRCRTNGSTPGTPPGISPFT